LPHPATTDLSPLSLHDALPIWADDSVGRKYSHAHLGCALARRGRGAEARQHFAAATALEDEPQLYSLRGIQEAEFKRARGDHGRSEEHTSELQSLRHLVCRLLL